MKIKQALLTVAIVITPMSALAAGSLDVFYMNQNAEDSVSKDDGNGVGIRGQATLGQGVSLTALLQDAELKDADENLRETRIGLSYDTKCHDIDVGGGVESVGVEFNDGGPGQPSLRGYSVNAHASISPIDNVTLSARVGYTDVDELAGMEYEVGASYAINKNVSGFVEYRMINADDEGFGADLDLDTLRVGARYNF